MSPFSQLLKSFRNAFRGLVFVWREERNFRIHVFCALAVFILSVIFQISITEFLMIFISVIVLLVLEIINSVFERLQDIIKPRIHHYVGFIKDAMAGAVLLGAINAALVSAIILYQGIQDRF